jgi:hypothetical protein
MLGVTCYVICDMFSTSNDILLLTISACVAAFTIFACWGLFYLVAGIRNLYGITKDFKNIFKKIEEVIDVLKNKIHESTAYLTLFGEVLKKVMDVAHAFGERHREKRAEREADEAKEECDCEECDEKCEDASDIKPSKPRKIKVK